MTITELFAAVAAAVAAAFDGSAFAVWKTPPDATGVPAVWPEYSNSFTGTDKTNGQVTFGLVAVIAPQVAAAEAAVIADAHDRFDTITAAAIGAGIAGRAGGLEVRQVGGVDHTALVYSLTVTRGLPC